MASPARERLDHALLVTIRAAVRVLPWTWLTALGAGLGEVVWRLGLYRRDVVLDNLAHAFGGEMDRSAREDLARRFYRHLGTTLTEFLAYDRLGVEGIERLTTLEGREHFDALVAGGGGGMLVSGHYGNWELLGARVAALGRKVSFIVKTQSNARVDRLQNETRARAGVGIIRSGASIKEMIRALRRGELIGMVADQDAGADGHFVEFLGRQASVFKGMARLAWKLKVPVLPGFIHRRPDGGHHVVLEEPFAADPDWDEQTAVERLTAVYVQRLEAAIRRHPEQYFWVHRRWKTRPPA